MSREIIQTTIPLESGFTNILFNLAAQGVKNIIIRYSGSGDSGQLDEMIAIKRDDSTEYELENSLKTRIENYVFSNLIDRLPDWYNNEGGGGELVIEVADASYSCDHYVNIEQDENYEDDGDDDYEPEYEEEHEMYEGKFGD